MCLWPGYHDTAKHGYKGVDRRVGWYSLESRFCLYASDGRTVYGVDLVNVISRSVLAHDTKAQLGFHGVGGHQLQLAVTFGVSAG